MIPRDLVLPRTTNEAIVGSWLKKELSDEFVVSRFGLSALPETVSELYRIAIALDVLSE